MSKRLNVTEVNSYKKGTCLITLQKYVGEGEMMTEAITILRIAKLLGVNILECTTYCTDILMLDFRSYITKQFMRAGKINFQVIFRQSLFRAYAVRCKLYRYRLKNN